MQHIKTEFCGANITPSVKQYELKRESHTRNLSITENLWSWKTLDEGKSLKQELRKSFTSCDTCQRGHYWIPTMQGAQTLTAGPFYFYFKNIKDKEMLKI